MQQHECYHQLSNLDSFSVLHIEYYFISFHSLFKALKLLLWDKMAPGKVVLLNFLTDLYRYICSEFVYLIFVITFSIYKTLSIDVGNNYVNKLPFTTTNWTTDYHFLLTRDSKIDIFLLFHFIFKRISACSK